ncbi:glycosyltransferase family 4 protein [Flavobacteriaceae bacterium LMO-SS05]
MKILFITHDTKRSGAQLILLRFLTWLKEHNNNVTSDILLLKGGELSKDFKSVANNLYNLELPPEHKRFKEILKKKVFKKIGYPVKSKEELIINSIVKQDYDVIYGNTVISIPIATLLKSKLLNTRLIIHVHELKLVINQVLPNFNKFMKDVDFFIAASYKVKNNLTDNFNVEKNRIKVVYEFSKISKSTSVKKESNKFIVGGSGQVNWRKGYDLFIQAAYFFKKKYPNCEIEFIWVGKNWTSDVVKSDLERAGLDQMVHFVGETKSPEEFYQKFDVFLMTSREDPFPLVCIEQAMFETPIICFENATGTEEILQGGGGLIVPYLDIEAMSEAIKYYYDNPEKVTSDGKKAKALFLEFTPEIKCPELYNIIKKSVNLNREK